MWCTAECYRRFSEYCERKGITVGPLMGIRRHLYRAEEGRCCDDIECWICGVMVCGHPWHFRYEGCPSCNPPPPSPPPRNFVVYKRLPAIQE